MGKKLITSICFIGIIGSMLYLGVGFALALNVPCSADADDCSYDVGSGHCSEPCYESSPGVWTGLNQPVDQVCICSPIGSRDIGDLLDKVVNYIFWFASAITPILILVGGFFFMTSGGDIEKVTKAKNIIFYTIVGYAIVLFARGLTSLLKGFLS